MQPLARLPVWHKKTQERLRKANLLGSGTEAVFDAMADLFAGWPARLNHRRRVGRARQPGPAALPARTSGRYGCASRPWPSNASDDQRILIFDERRPEEGRHQLNNPGIQAVSSHVE